TPSQYSWSIIACPTLQENLYYLAITHKPARDPSPSLHSGLRLTALRMTSCRGVVILSAAKDLCRNSRATSLLFPASLIEGISFEPGLPPLFHASSHAFLHGLRLCYFAEDP